MPPSSLGRRSRTSGSTRSTPSRPTSAWRSSGDWMAAEGFHTEAMEVALRTAQPKRVAVAQNNLGLVHLGRGDPARARDFLNEALIGIESTGDRYITAELYETIGRVELRLG